MSIGKSFGAKTLQIENEVPWEPRITYLIARSILLVIRVPDTSGADPDPTLEKDPDSTHAIRPYNIYPYYSFL